jgi:hypothetical protein
VVVDDGSRHPRHFRCAPDRTLSTENAARGVEAGAIGCRSRRRISVVAGGKQAFILRQDIDIFRFDDRGRIVEDWDVLQRGVPATSLHENSMS